MNEIAQFLFIFLNFLQMYEKKNFFVVTVTGIIQIMKPVQPVQCCTGFKFCTFRPVVRIQIEWKT